MAYYSTFYIVLRVMLNYMDIGKGAETGTPPTMHWFLRSQHPDVETEEEAVKTVIYMVH